MLKVIITSFLCLINSIAYAGKYDDYQANPNVLNGASGSDDYVLVTMVTVIFIGSSVVAHLFKRPYYTPVKEVVIFIVVCLAIGYFWATHN
jgi:hypothetical protein